MKELVAVRAALVAEALGSEIVSEKAAVAEDEGAGKAPYRIGHDNGANHACAEVALLASRGEERHLEPVSVQERDK